MKLTHYSQTPFHFDPKRQYPGDPADFVGNFKPHGLWLSDETDFGWKKWCEEGEYSLDGLNNVAEFECDLAKWCVLKNDREIFQFTQQYEKQLFQSIKTIEWDQVKKEFSGILITPYSWKARMDQRSFWYYGWDCASGIAWDLSTVKLVHQVGPIDPTVPTTLAEVFGRGKKVLEKKRAELREKTERSRRIREDLKLE